MTVVFIEIDGLLGEGFIIAVVILNTGLVYDDLGVFYHKVANIHFRVQPVRAGNRDIAIDIYPAFQILAIEDHFCKCIFIPAAKADKGVLVEGPFCQVSGEGSFAGAGNAKIDVQHESGGRIAHTIAAFSIVDDRTGRTATDGGIIGISAGSTGVADIRGGEKIAVWVICSRNDLGNIIGMGVFLGGDGFGFCILTGGTGVVDGARETGSGGAGGFGPGMGGGVCGERFGFSLVAGRAGVVDSAGETGSRGAGSFGPGMGGRVCGEWFGFGLITDRTGVVDSAGETSSRRAKSFGPSMGGRVCRN